ncbi:MAG: ABC transporter ATP-binding protein [Candidatus Woesebacteria bacterium]|jgi:ABC-type multidrug transport system fused ATPase/permease subunit
MVRKRLRERLSKPKVTFDRLDQVIFTLREVIKLAFRIKPKLLTSAFILNALWGFLAVPGFYLQKLIIDKLIESVGTENIQPVLVSVGTLVLIALLLSLFRNFLSGYNGHLRRSLSRLFEAELSIIIGKKLAELDMATIDDPKFQDRFSKIEKESGRRAWGLMIPLSDIPNYLVGFISALGVIVFLNPLIAVGVFLVSLPQIFIDSKYIKKGYDLYTQLSPLRRLWRWLEMYLFRNRNIMELKLLDISGYLSKRLRKVVDKVLNKQLNLSRRRELSRAGSLLPLTIYELGVSLLLVFWVIVRKITVGSFQLYISSLRSAEQNLTGLMSSILEIYENYIYVSDLVWFLNLESKIEKSGGKKIVDKNLSLEFKDVWFKYRDDQPWVLEGVSFKINPGERIALVGENGAGKSTLIKLIARFYDPNKGKVVVRGNDLKEYDVLDWRERLSVLFQQFEGYPFTVAESIGFGDVKRVKNIEDVKKAAKETGIDDYIEQLPLKYNNPLTPRFEQGVRPSEGQRQRIGISRALFRKDAKILILDEPTSNIDPEAEERIFGKLVRNTKKKILIFITQRFSTVRVADRIFVMHGGKLIEKGTHRNLMKKRGKYAKMFTIQAKSYLESSKYEEKV